MKLVYDIVSLPKGLDPGNMTKIFEQHHLVYWDSSLGGTKPQLYLDNGERAILAVVDTKGVEMDMAQYSEQFLDKEFWDKELHKCMNSPTYFWANYGTPVYPHTNDGLREFLAEIGLKSIEEKDSQKAAELWKEQKEATKEAMKHVTIEFLEERKAAVDLLKASYDKKVLELESLVRDHVRLFDSNNAPITDSKRETNLIKKIRESSPVLVKYSDIYRNKKGRWDTPILINTGYDVLLQMYYDVLVYHDRIKENVVSPTKKLGRT